MHKPQLPHIFWRRKSPRSVARCRSVIWRGILHVSASAVVCSDRFLPTDYQPWTRFGEAEAGFQASSPEAEVETRDSSAGLYVQAKADRAHVTYQRWQVADEWLRRLSLAASRPKLEPLPLEATLRKANSLSSICRQRNDLSPSLSLTLFLSLSLSLFLSLSLSLSLFLSLFLSLSFSLSLSLFLSLLIDLDLHLFLALSPSLSLSLTQTHILCLYFAFHSQAHQCICMVAQSPCSVLLLCWCLLTQRKL